MRYMTQKAMLDGFGLTYSEAAELVLQTKEATGVSFWTHVWYGSAIYLIFLCYLIHVSRKNQDSGTNAICFLLGVIGLIIIILAIVCTYCFFLETSMLSINETAYCLYSSGGFKDIF